LVQVVRVLAVIGQDVVKLRNNTRGSLRILLDQLLRDLSSVHSLARVEAIKITSELLEASDRDIERNNRALQEKKKELAEMLARESKPL
jgi:hypothetical protein